MSTHKDLYSYQQATQLANSKEVFQNFEKRTQLLLPGLIDLRIKDVQDTELKPGAYVLCLVRMAKYKPLYGIRRIQSINKEKFKDSKKDSIKKIVSIQTTHGLTTRKIYQQDIIAEVEIGKLSARNRKLLKEISKDIQEQMPAALITIDNDCAKIMISMHNKTISLWPLIQKIKIMTEVQENPIEVPSIAGAIDSIYQYLTGQKHHRQPILGAKNKLFGKKDKKPCQYCGVIMTRKQATIDHKVPLARFGSNDDNNLALACERCNNLKGSLTDKEFHDLIKNNKRK